MVGLCILLKTFQDDRQVGDKWRFLLLREFSQLLKIHCCVLRKEISVV